MYDQPAYVTRDEFERRMRVLESEINGEKAVTRHVLGQARLNGDDLAAMKAQLSHIEDDMVVVKTALNSHGNRLNVLTQDVREIRTEMGQVRTEMDQMRTEMGEMRTEMGGMRTEIGQIRATLNRQEGRLNALDVLAQDVAAIRAALAPPAPPAE
jgi:chromosome segregation ATPase